MANLDPRNWPAAQRQWVYRIGLACIALMLTYKLIGPEHAPLWIDLLANILGVGGGAAAAGTADVVLKGQRKDGVVE